MEGAKAIHSLQYSHVRCIGPKLYCSSARVGPQSGLLHLHKMSQNSVWKACLNRTVWQEGHQEQESTFHGTCVEKQCGIQLQALAGSSFDGSIDWCLEMFRGALPPGGPPLTVAGAARLAWGR